MKGETDLKTENMYYNQQKRSEVKEEARRLRRKFLRYQQAEIVYSLSHKKLMELANDAGAIYRMDGIVLIGLIEKRRQGFGKVTIIYVKSFIQEECEEQKKEKPKMVKFTNQTSVEEEETEEVYISNFKKSQKQTSRSPENKLQEVYISNSNNTNINNTTQY